MFEVNHRWIPGAVSVLVVLSMLLFFVACGQPAPEVAEVPESPATPEFRLPVSLNEVMVSLVNHAADPIWVAAWHNPQTDREWRELERLASQLEIAGALLKAPGTGEMDLEWVNSDVWLAWADELRRAGQLAVAAVESREIAQVSAAGDRIVEVCEGCHIDFKPAEPTEGKYGELSPTAADFEDEGP